MLAFHHVLLKFFIFISSFVIINPSIKSNQIRSDQIKSNSFINNAKNIPPSFANSS